MPCERCERLPAPLSGTGRLHVWFPIAHAAVKAVTAVEALGAGLRRGPAQYEFAVAGDEMPTLLAGLRDALTSLESDDTRVVFTSGDTDLGAVDFARVDSLTRLAAFAEAGWLLRLLEEERLTAHFQPIVDAMDTTRVFAHEALARGLDTSGALINPGRLFGAAGDAGLLFQLDLATRRTAIREAVRHRLDTHLFVNFTPTSVYDPTTCLRTTVQAIDEGGLPHDRVVFEVTESERTGDPRHLVNILDAYRASGFRVALDDVGAGYSSLNLLHQIKPDFIKLDMGLVRDVHRDGYKAAVASKLLEIAHLVGARTVAEGVETAGELEWLRAHGTDLVQGFAIARPAPAPVGRTLAGALDAA